MQQNKNKIGLRQRVCNNGNDNYMKLHAAFTQSGGYLHYGCCTFHVCSMLIIKYDVMWCFAYACIAYAHLPKCRIKIADDFSTVVCIQINTFFRILSLKWFNDTGLLHTHTHIYSDNVFKSYLWSNNTLCVCVCVCSQQNEATAAAVTACWAKQ